MEWSLWKWVLNRRYLSTKQATINPTQRRKTMKRLILLFSHSLTPEQRDDATDNLGVGEFISLDSELQRVWSNVPPSLESLDEYLRPIKDFVSHNLNQDDIVLVQGDFGATFAMVSFVHSIGGVAVYATTRRDVVEEESKGEIVKTSIFRHIRFREYL